MSETSALSTGGRDLPPEVVGAFAHLDSLSRTLEELARTSGRMSPGAVSAPVMWTESTAGDFYRANGYAANIVDMMVNDSLRKGYEVTVSETEDDGDGGTDAHPFDDDLKRLGLSEKLSQCDKMARLAGTAAIYVGTLGGGAPSQRLNPAGLRKVTHLTVVEGWFLDPEKWQSNFLLPGYGEPETYMIQPQSAGGSASVRTEVHRSRLIIMDGRWLPWRLRQENPHYMGDSLLQLAWRSIQDLSRADQDIGVILRSFSQGVLKISGLQQLFAGGNCEAVRDRLALTNAGLSSLGMTVLDSEGGEDLTYATRTVAGLSDLYDRLVQRLASVARMPVSKLMGQGPGGLSTDDAAGTRSWDDQVQAHQSDDLQLPVERIVTLLAESSKGPTDGSLVPFHVSWRPLRQPTEKETAEVRKMQAETDNIYWGMGDVLTSSEIRESRFGGPVYSAETTLQADATLDDIAEEEAEISE